MIFDRNIKTELAIIGGGPAGYAAAMAAVEQGVKCVLIEKNDIGGVCLHNGCIPTKSMLYRLHCKDHFEKLFSTGICADNVTCGWQEMKLFSLKMKRMLEEAMVGALKNSGVTVLWGEAAFIAPNALCAELHDGGRVRISAKGVVIAAGSAPKAPPIPAPQGCFTSDDVLSRMDELPKRMAIVGGGASGVEFASLFSRLGTSVSIFEADDFLSAFDREIAASLKNQLVKSGVGVFANSAIERIEKNDGEFELSLSGGKPLRTDAVLFCTGRAPNLRGLGLEAAGIATDEDWRIIVDSKMKTSTKNIYAVGDCASRMLCANAASYEGRVAVSDFLGGDLEMRYDSVPVFVYSVPEAAMAGLTLKRALAEGYDAVEGTAYPSANPMSRITNSYAGMVKIVAEKAGGRVLGAHMLCDGASEMISFFSFMIRTRGSVFDILSVPFAHPVKSEIIYEAALDTARRCG